MPGLMIIITFLLAGFIAQAQSSFVGIDSLKDGKQYTVEVIENGCFHKKKIMLILTRHGENYYAKANSRLITFGEKMNTLKKSFNNVQLPKNIQDSVRLFEKELVIFSEQVNACTTVDTYHLSINNTKLSYRIEPCIWDGISQLLNIIFNKSPN